MRCDLWKCLPTCAQQSHLALKYLLKGEGGTDLFQAPPWAKAPGSLPAPVYSTITFVCLLRVLEVPLQSFANKTWCELPSRKVPFRRWLAGEAGSS